MKYSHPVRGRSSGRTPPLTKRTPLTKWEEEGQVVEGEYRGKHGDLGIVPDKDNLEVVFPLHRVLLGKLTKVKLGFGVSILYKGEVESKSGTTYKDFDVFTESAEAIEAEPTELGDDVPF